MKEYPDNKLYNKRVFGLPEFDLNVRHIRLRYSRHATIRLDEYNREFGWRFGDVKAPSVIDLDEVEVVELEATPEGEVVKIVGRYSIDPNRDLVLIIVLDNCTVKTMWVNNKDDQHRTINKKGYDRP
jgi:hypothetical protein